MAREPRALLAILTNEIADLDQETWIFLDDFHCLDGSQEVGELVDYFVRRLPPNCQLVVASRTPPGLPSLSRLLLEGRALELGPSELAFTANEIKAYYRSARKQHISDEQADRILQITQGWPAAVAALNDLAALGPGREEPLSPMSDYLAAEVYGRLSERLREFLLQSSVFDTLEASGCDAILGEEGSASLLQGLEKQNVPLMRAGGAIREYRLHPLFRDFLRHELLLRSPELYRRLNLEAGTWEANRGRPNEAIWHFAQAEDWDQVARLIEEEAPTAYKVGRWHTVTSWLELISRDERRRRPSLQLWQARILARLGQSDEALRAISEAVDGLKDSDSVLFAEFETIRAAALRLKGELTWALAAARRAVELAARNNAPINVLAEARKQLGQALFIQGSFSEAAVEFRTALEVYQQRGDIEETAFLSCCLGSALGSEGKLVESVTYLEEARRQWRKVGNAKELSWVLNNLAMTYYQMGQVELARELFIDALNNARASGHQRIEAWTLVSLADIDRQSGDPNKAVERYEDALALAADLGEMPLLTYALTGLAGAYGQLGDIGKAEVLARQALASGQDRESPYEVGLAQTALGRLMHRLGKPDEAISAFSAAAASFERVNANKELAEALFYLADSYLAVRHSRTLLRATLERLATAAGDLGHDYFLVQAVREAPAVAQYSVSRRIGGVFYRELLRRSVSADARPDARPRSGAIPAGRFPVVEVTSLGDVEVRIDGRSVLDFEWESEKSKELFLLLLIQDRPLRRDEIVVALWPDSSGSRASSSFHSCLYRVRRALYPECVVESGGAYVLNPQGTFLCDAREFQRLADAAAKMTEDGVDYLESSKAAVGLYRGPFAPNVDGEWADTRRMRLEGRFLELAARLGDALLRRGEHSEAGHVFERLLACDPYDEAACHKLMEAHAASGTYEAALRAYRRCSEALQADLGERPGDALVRFHSEIRLRLGRAVGQPP